MLIQNTIGKFLTAGALAITASILLSACDSQTAAPAGRGSQAAQAPADVPKFAINVQRAGAQGVTVDDIAQAMNDFLKTHGTIHSEDLKNIPVHATDPDTGAAATGRIHHLDEFVTIK